MAETVTAQPQAQPERRTGSGSRSRSVLADLIREGAPITRADLTRLSGLSRSAVAAGVQHLIDDGLVQEAVAPSGRRGRPATVLRPQAPSGALVGIDFGHAHVAVAVADGHGTVLAERRVPMDVDSHCLPALDAAVELVGEQLDAAGAEAAAVRAVVAAIPGPVDSRSGLVQSATILSSWVGISPADVLRQRLGCPVDLGNDAELGAVGELTSGAGRGADDLVYVKASHGIGAGLVLGGRVHRGTAGIAGEIGHTQIDGAGDPCRCGQRGCLEAMISTSVVRRRLELTGFPLTADDDALHSVVGHPVAARVVTEAGRHLGRVLADICNCLNPARIVLGGELGASGVAFAAGVRESVVRYAQPAIAAAVEVRTAELGRRAELVGALAVGMRLAARRSRQADR